MRIKFQNKSKLLFFLFAAIIFSSCSNISTSTKKYEDLLNYRSGFAKDVTGGAGGEVVVISDLEDDSFKRAIESKGAKWIRFNTSGTIYFTDTIKIESDKTIDGRGVNIVISSIEGKNPQIHLWGVDNHNLIIHNITFSNIGIDKNRAFGLSIGYGASGVWVDHCTFSKIGHESISIGQGATDVTVGWCVQ